MCENELNDEKRKKKKKIWEMKLNQFCDVMLFNYSSTIRHTFIAINLRWGQEQKVKKSIKYKSEQRRYNTQVSSA